jgi:uncharacterized membrane protein
MPTTAWQPYVDVHRERMRAHLKHGAKGNSREFAPWDDPEWLPILMEELGEVAHELTYDAADTRRLNLRAELVQVAAMACAWITALDYAAMHERLPTDA